MGGILEVMKKIEHRIHRIQGQLRSLETAIAEGKDCTDVIPQFLAAKGAFQSAFTAYMEESLHDCAHSDTEKIQSLLAILIKS